MLRVQKVDLGFPVKGNMRASPCRGGGLGGAGGDQLVQLRHLVLTGAKDAAQALHVFAHAAGARDHNADGSLGDIHAFVEDAARHQYRPATGAEIIEHIPALFPLVWWVRTGSTICPPMA